MRSTTSSTQRVFRSTNSFPGFCRVFHRFVPEFTRVAVALNRKLRKYQPTHLEKIAENKLLSLQILHQELFVLPVLALMKSAGTYALDTDVCDPQADYVLLHQQPEGSDKPIGNWSRFLNYAKRAYNFTYKECLAVVWALVLLKP